MPPKRKASTVAARSKSSKRPTSATVSGVATPQSIGSSDEYSQEGEEASETEVEALSNAKEIFSAGSLKNRSKLQSRSNEQDLKISGINDLSYLKLKTDHENRPLWIDARKARIILESFSPLASHAQDFLTTIAEPLSRPEFLHEYGKTFFLRSTLLDFANLIALTVHR